MLSGETTVGKYPIDCVKIFDRVSRRIEASGGAGYAELAVLDDIRQKTMASAVKLANSVTNSKIVVFTRRGFMADHASHLRPVSAPIFAFSPNEAVVRRLTLNRGVHAIRMAFSTKPEHTVAEAEEYLKQQGLANAGDELIILSDIVTGEERFDSIQLRRVV
ncbi:MAG TPA: pyruvate kinase alpha/beta domain-containing protein, partial [Chthoniobacterales bacterium]